MITEISKITLDIFECNKCELAATAKNKVISRGTSEHPEILFIGEAPGNEEDKVGIPFIGRSGKVLDEMIEYMKIEDFAIINRLCCHPPHNDNPTPSQLEACYPFLLRRIEYFNPVLIILLGKFANEGFGPKLKWGEIMEYDGRYYAKLYHPAALLHNGSNKIPQREYMNKIVNLLSELKLKRNDK